MDILKKSLENEKTRKVGINSKDGNADKGGINFNNRNNSIKKS